MKYNKKCQTYLDVHLIQKGMGHAVSSKQHALVTKELIANNVSNGVVLLHQLERSRIRELTVLGVGYPEIEKRKKKTKREAYIRQSTKTHTHTHMYP